MELLSRDISTMEYKTIEDHIIATHIDGIELFNEDSVIVDCGACVGNFTLPLYNEYKSNFYLYEPDPRNHRRVCRRFKNESKIRIMNLLIDTQQGEIEFCLGNFITASSKYPSHRGLGNQTVKVKTTTLDWEFKNIDRIDLLKLDLEGSEKEVIPSLSKEFLNKVNQISVEYHLQAEIDGYTESDVKLCRSYLRNKGFKEIAYDATKYNGGQEACYINKRLL